MGGLGTGTWRDACGISEVTNVTISLLGKTCKLQRVALGIYSKTTGSPVIPKAALCHSQILSKSDIATSAMSLFFISFWRGKGK